MSSLRPLKREIQECDRARDVLVNKLKDKMAKRVKKKVKGSKMPEMCFSTQSGISFLKRPVEETSWVSSMTSKEDYLMPRNGQGSCL